MLGSDLPLWLAAALAGVGAMFAVGVVHALAIRVHNDRDVHHLRVRATRLRLDQLERLAQRMRGEARQPDEDHDTQAPIPDSGASPADLPAQRAA